MIQVLIRNAEWDGQRRDVLVREGRLAEIAMALPRQRADLVIDADGAALLPGLNDHHLHLAAAASARSSIDCGPPADEQVLGRRLRGLARQREPDHWVRGTGYHESVAGDIDAEWIDRQLPDCPVRIQHRSGRLWVLNSRALDLLSPRDSDPLERVGGVLTGRLYDADAWLRQRLAERVRPRYPELSDLSRELARYGVTGVTDTSPGNGPDVVEHLTRAQSRGELLQRLRVMGNATLNELAASSSPGGPLVVGERKFHLLESRLPDFDVQVADIVQAHEAGRGAAFHCVSRTELVFAIEALKVAGVRPGDRVEHAAILPPELLAEVAQLDLTIVTQPAFVAARGDHYLADVDRDDQPWLYRLRGVLEAGIALAGSSDAPFGPLNPWLAMAAAVSRKTAAGDTIGSGEALTPEQALAMYCGPLDSPGQGRSWPSRGAVADLCLLSSPWSWARQDLSQVKISATIAGGRVIWSKSTWPRGSNPTG